MLLLMVDQFSAHRSSRRNMEKRDGNSGFKLTLYAVDGMDTTRDRFECMISRLRPRLNKEASTSLFTRASAAAAAAGTGTSEECGLAAAQRCLPTSHLLPIA